MINKIIKPVVIASFILTLASCGGGDDSSGSTSSAPPAAVAAGVNGLFAAFSAKTTGAICILRDEAGTEIVTKTTGSNGAVSFENITIPEGIVILTCSGGTYIDEATGSTLNSPTLRAATNYTGGELQLIASPLSEVAYQLANSDSDLSDIATQNEQVADSFGLDDIDFTEIVPTDLNDSPAENDEAGRVGLVLAGLSQVFTQHTDAESGITTLVTDLSDGTVDDVNSDISAAIEVLQTNGAGASSNVAQSSEAEGAVANNEGDSAASVAVTDVLVSGPTSIALGGFIFLNSTVLPVNATDSTVTWFVDPTLATIDASGKLTVVSGVAVNQELLIFASANDGSNEIGQIRVTTQAVADNIEPQIANHGPIIATTVDVTASSAISLEGLVSDNNSASIDMEWKIVNMAEIDAALGINSDGKHVVTISGDEDSYLYKKASHADRTANANEIFINPTSTIGSVNVKLQARDEAGNQSDIHSFSVTVNRAIPSITASVASVSVGEGTVLPSVTMDESVGGLVASYSISPDIANTPGLSFNSSNGTISGTPTTPASIATYTVTGTNVSGSDTAVINITVLDITLPVVTLVGDNPQTIVVTTAYSELGATANDNVDGDITAQIVIDTSNVNINAPGSYIVTYNIFDAEGNAGIQQSRTVNVVDVTAPSLVLIGNNPQSIDRGNAYLELGATATDNVDGNITAQIVIDTTAIDTNVPGTYSVTYDISDASGNAAPQQLRTVTVIDVAEPVIILTGADPQNISIDTGIYTELGATASDDVEGDVSAQIVIDASAVDVNALGSYSVTYNVSDSAGNTATQRTRTVNVIDITAPVLTLTGNNPQTLTVTVAYPELGATAVDNVDGNLDAQIVIDTSAVNINVPGSYTVTYNVSDNAGNVTAEETRTVNVVDITAPVLVLSGGNPQTINVGTAYSELGATATDDVDGDITAQIVIDASNVNINVPGSYTVTYNISDAFGNVAAPQSRIVNVVDTVIPVITLTGDNPQAINTGTAYSELGATASDNADGDITAQIVIDASAVDTNTAGSYSVTYNVSDTSGNVAVQITRTVTVSGAVVVDERPLLVIRVEFNDYTFQSSESVWADKIFGTSQGQLNHYFNEVSKGKFQFTPANETDGVNDNGVITVQLNENHPGDSTLSFQTQLGAAVTLADTFINFATYDTNLQGGSVVGTMDEHELNIIFVVAGGETSTGDAAGSSIWAHAWAFQTPPTHDGIVLMQGSSTGLGYARFGERHDNDSNPHDATIGIIAHELGHLIFNLPDLYDTDSSSNGIGYWGLMASGTWGKKPGDTYSGETPAHMIGWTKAKVGFITPTVISATGLYTINDSANNDTKIYRLNTDSANEYFLLENRNAVGYDLGLDRLDGVGFFGGLLITHIDDNQTNNDTDAQRLVDVEEAAEPGLDAEIHEGHIDNLYFNGNTVDFTDATSPNSKKNNGVATGVEVESVSSAGAVMQFTVNGLGE